jgi:hypothetical protein
MANFPIAAVASKVAYLEGKINLEVVGIISFYGKFPHRSCCLEGSIPRGRSANNNLSPAMAIEQVLPR